MCGITHATQRRGSWQWAHMGCGLLQAGFIAQSVFLRNQLPIPGIHCRSGFQLMEKRNLSSLRKRQMVGSEPWVAIYAALRNIQRARESFHNLP